jgi:hypothetical protein
VASHELAWTPRGEAFLEYTGIIFSEWELHWSIAFGPFATTMAACRSLSLSLTRMERLQGVPVVTPNSSLLHSSNLQVQDLDMPDEEEYARTDKSSHTITSATASMKLNFLQQHNPISPGNICGALCLRPDTPLWLSYLQPPDNSRPISMRSIGANTIGASDTSIESLVCVIQ